MKQVRGVLNNNTTTRKYLFFETYQGLFSDWNEWSEYEFRNVRFRCCNSSVQVQINSTYQVLYKGNFYKNVIFVILLFAYNISLTFNNFIISCGIKAPIFIS
jgi:hypothetical protein